MRARRRRAGHRLPRPELRGLRMSVRKPRDALRVQSPQAWRRQSGATRPRLCRPAPATRLGSEFSRRSVKSSRTSPHSWARRGARDWACYQQFINGGRPERIGASARRRARNSPHQILHRNPARRAPTPARPDPSVVLVASLVGHGPVVFMS